jgi:hypothetical protein
VIFLAILYSLKSGAGAGTKSQGNAFSPAIRRHYRRPSLGLLTAQSPVFTLMFTTSFHWENESGIEPFFLSLVDGTPPENSLAVPGAPTGP